MSDAFGALVIIYTFMTKERINPVKIQKTQWSATYQTSPLAIPVTHIIMLNLNFKKTFLYLNIQFLFIYEISIWTVGEDVNPLNFYDSVN